MDQLYTTFLQQHNLIKHQFKLEQQAKGALTRTQQQEYERILQLCTEGIIMLRSDAES